MTKRSARSLLVGLGFAALSYGAGVLGHLAMGWRGSGNAKRLWFRTLRKPAFEPPRKVFPIVWGVLYGAMAYSAWRVWRAPKSPERTRALALWGSQLALNAAWTPLFFAAKRPALALADIAALDVAATGYTLQAKRVDGQAALVITPYLGWLGFATALNGAIVAKND
jgi:translocator protein